MTGQAAWFDLRVKVEKATEDRAGETSEPQFPALTPVATVPRGDAILRYGAKGDRQ